MEAKLMMAAAKLPGTSLEFDSIEQAAKCRNGAVKRPRVLRRALLAAVLVLCLSVTVFAYGKTHYGLWSGYSSDSFADVEILSRRYDYIFPEQLGERAFLRMSTTLGAPQGASHWDAIWAPTYKLHTVNYDDLSVSFGTTELDTWKYHFSVAEDGSCSAADVLPGSQSIEEYKEYTIYLYAIGNCYSARWVDEARSLVIDVTCPNTDNFETVLAVANELIDLNG